MDIHTVADSFSRHWPLDRVVATTGQLLHAGLDTRIIEAGVERNLILRLRRGVYVPMHTWQGAKPWDRDKMVLAGHIAVSNGRCVYSHFSSARLHDLQLWNSSKLIHVSTPYSASPARTSQDIAVHFAKIAPRELVQRFIPGVGLAHHTSLPRTVLECAMRGSLEQAVIIGDSALHAGLNLNELAELAE
ncbi:type IV toxin-antitoxin system AbiEi family antitoxin domain-containing protein [Arthrobacter glacialis]|uniref:type IV toxin-antitoxin system AbiEi family antitoxin domain-containing protein n=1 Tax=Arthrobacter glacialis TaxID=1664 RepID=UPI001056E255|nr:type IV toxin-antitoxin system AbiEi family antitoxin domain-containing protein [Arthrobacter glacialis]